MHLCMLSGGANTLRVALRQRAPGEARQAIATLFGAIRPVKHIFVYDEDIDIREEGQVAWARWAHVFRPTRILSCCKV